jgi:hypothetical protein
LARDTQDAIVRVTSTAASCRSSAYQSRLYLHTRAVPTPGGEHASIQLTPGATQPQARRACNGQFKFSVRYSQ